jgi:hypothetical protein
MLLLCCNPGVEAKLVGYIRASLSAAHILARIKKELEAAFVYIADMANRDVIKDSAVDESWWSRFPAAV